MSSDEAIPTPPAPSKLLPVVLVLCLGNLGATAFVALKVVKIKAVAAEGAAHGPEGGAAAKNSPVVPFDPPFVVNLNEPNSTRYLKVAFELELAHAGAVEELDRSKKAVRDEVLRYLSGLAVADTMGETGKSKIQNEVLARIDRSLGGGKARRLFYTEFVVQ
jgi:flagellar basal body-associated protein FliL